MSNPRASIRAPLALLACSAVAALFACGCSGLPREPAPGQPAPEREQTRQPPLDPAEVGRRLDEARGRLEAGDVEAAQRAFEALIPRSRGPQRAEALLGAAEAALRRGQHWRAHRWLQRLLREHPDAPNLSRAIRLEYEIGVAFIEGKARRPGWAGLWRSDRAFGAELLGWLVDSYEQNYFDYALFLIGEHHYRAGRWREAAEAYLRLEQEFPDSLWVGPALVQRASCHLHMQRGYAYDDTEMREAERLFRAYLTRFPQGDRRVQAEQGLGQIAELRARLYTEIAHFYLHNEGRPHSALVYLEAVVRECPFAPSAGRAPALLDAVARRAERRGDTATRELALAAARELRRLRAQHPGADGGTQP